MSIFIPGIGKLHETPHSTSIERLRNTRGTELEQKLADGFYAVKNK